MDTGSNNTNGDMDIEQLKEENHVMRGKIEQNEHYVRYLVDSKMETVMAMSAEIEKLRQQILQHNKVCCAMKNCPSCNANLCCNQ